LAAARAAGAATYAPDEIGAAERALAAYDDAVARRDYRQALSLAIDARDGAYEAARRAADRRAIAQAGAERLILEAEGLLREIETRLASSPSSRGTPTDAGRWQTLHDSGTRALQEARSLVGNREFPAAQARVAPVVEDLRAALNPAAGAERR
jgi:hypothetical protein